MIAAEYISYRFTRDEWETVRMLLSLEVPLGLEPATPDADACRAAYDSLCGQGLLTPSGDSVIVDRLFAFLATQACGADVCLAVRSEQCHLLLHRAPDLFLLSAWTRGRCAMTPLPGLAAVREPLLREAKRCTAPADLELIAGGKTVCAASAATRDELTGALEDFYQRFFIQTLENREA